MLLPHTNPPTKECREAKDSADCPPREELATRGPQHQATLTTTQLV